MRKVAVIVVVGAVALVLAACVPKFPVGGSATASAVDGLPVLRWTGAIIDGEGESVAGYRIEIDGTLATTVAAPATFCTLLNLPSSTLHSIRITAVSAKGAGSQGLPANGILTASITPPSYYGNGGSPTCVAGNDADGDGLLDEVETGTGTFTSASSTGTSPKKVDTDGDALTDREEVLGTAAGLDLPSFGVSPTKKDILLEYDWFDDALDCGAHSHRPSAAAVDRFTQAFADAPVVNPDGTTGVHAVVDSGQGGALTGGNLIADADGVLTSGVNSAEYTAIKVANVDPKREGYFHYVLGVHNYNTNSTSSGQAELPGDDLIVSLQCYLDDEGTANTIMHELGHNLGLGHGGSNSENYKPNYNSVMNYLYQFPGVDTTCDTVGDGVLDYSAGARLSIDENAVVEANGVCPGVPVDFNKNGAIDASPYVRDLNQNFNYRVLTDFNDWANLNFGAIKDADGASPNSVSDEPQIITEQPVPGS